jgi:hypothetical protein
MPTDDRDQQFERALARHLSNASPDSTCPDAEILAAYHERTLSLKEMAQWKEHIAACTRCQEALALVEQSESVPAEEWKHQADLEPIVAMALPKAALAGRAIQPSEEVPTTPSAAATASTMSARSPRPRPPWKLLVPIGALAASVILFIGAREIRKQRAQQLQSVQMAQNRPAIPQPTAPPSDALERSRKEEPPIQKMDRETPLQSAPGSPKPQMVAPPRSQTPAKAAEPSGSFDELAAGKRKDALPSAAATAAAPQPRPTVSGDVAKSVPNESAERSANATATGGAVNALGGKKAENLQVQAPTTNQYVQLQSATPALDAASSEMATKVRDKMALLRVASQDRSYVVAPGERHAWRVGNAGRIEHSTDHGKTWKPQQSGVSVDLTTGSATSDKVCWIIGKAGTLLLTTDGGKHWNALSSPIAEDLGGIHAADAMHASIWDVPNRKSFETNDGGVTWQRTANE